MSAKLWCVVCQDTRSLLWMASDLVLPASQLTVLERLGGLHLKLQPLSILCNSCYSLVELWDKQISAATETEQALKGLITYARERLDEDAEKKNESVLIREHNEDNSCGPASLSCAFGVEKVKPAKGSSDLLVAGERTVAGSLVTDSDRSHAEPSDRRLSSDCDAPGSGIPVSAEADVTDLGGVEVCGPAPAAVPVTSASALEVQSSDAVEGLTTPFDASDLIGEPERGGAATDRSPSDVADDAAASGRHVDGVSPAADPTPPSETRTASRHRCHICGKGFARGGSLADHLAAHAGTKGYVCAECGESFQYRDGLLVHRRRHHGGGRLSCPHCSQRFEKSCNLRRHLRVHTGERPFGCTFCPKRFAQSNGLKKHVRSLHGDRVSVKPS
ncbi:zinc finger protein 358-like [Amphibalanus amphitrite]|uniref:zinc finger protein 358-like n=1 Tax=Amphibalanus amphitrite TaxID=1232801 RepID=UPI001C910E87|nr:zinc finger protein 358-like [Amphibalanus amphitrite]